MGHFGSRGVTCRGRRSVSRARGTWPEKPGLDGGRLALRPFAPPAPHPSPDKPPVIRAPRARGEGGEQLCRPPRGRRLGWVMGDGGRGRGRAPLARNPGACCAPARAAPPASASLTLETARHLPISERNAPSSGHCGVLRPRFRRSAPRYLQARPAQRPSLKPSLLPGLNRGSLAAPGSQTQIETYE